MIYSEPKLISLDSLNSTYKEASGVCTDGTSNIAFCGPGAIATSCVNGGGGT